jgi:hypothetical protein
MALTMTPSGVFHPNLRANPALLPFVMFHSCLLFISILRAVNEVFGQPWTRSIDGFFGDLRSWAQANKGVGRVVRG